MISATAPDLKIFENSEDLVSNLVGLALTRIESGLALHGIFHLALTGGSLGNRISQVLVSRWNESPSEYGGLHLWWSDERFVPEMSTDRNAFVVMQQLNDDSLIHVHQVLASDSNVDLQVAARRYNADLYDVDVNLAILGLGPDGHVASLFPGQWHEGEEASAIAVSNSPKPPSQRVSFSMAKINASHSVWMVASGATKHRAVEDVVSRIEGTSAAYVHGRDETLLFVDRAALVSG